MKTSELKKLLEANGCRKVDEGGNHEKWFSPVIGNVNKPCNNRSYRKLAAKAPCFSYGDEAAPKICWNRK